MPDITMCEATNCPKSSSCVRHQDSGTKPNSYQSFFFGMTKVYPECSYYWPRDNTIGVFNHD